MRRDTSSTQYATSGCGARRLELALRPDPESRPEVPAARDRAHTPGCPSTLANFLNRREALRRDLTPPVFVTTGGKAPENLKPMPLHWQPEGGRLVSRETASGRVLAGIGPDGYTRGETAAEGEPFSKLGPYTPDGPRPGCAILEGDRRILALLASATPVTPPGLGRAHRAYRGEKAAFILPTPVGSGPNHRGSHVPTTRSWSSSRTGRGSAGSGSRQASP